MLDILGLANEELAAGEFENIEVLHGNRALSLSLSR
jgi:hypothetical protein